MSETSPSGTPTHQILAIICFGLFAGAMALNAISSTEEEATPTRGVIWNAFQYGIPLLIGGICLTGIRWTFMTAVIYGTVGLALDMATFVQSLTGGNDPAEFIIIISTTALLNFLLIVFGGRAVLQTQ